jgi:hypothetical protein
MAGMSAAHDHRHITNRVADLFYDSAQTGAVVFEAFEISPSSAEVLASERALVRDFPDCSA